MTVLKLGSSGHQVTQLQQRLGVIADGRYGPATAQAVKELQQQHGLVADGIVGPATWRILHQPSYLHENNELKRVTLPAHAGLFLNGASMMHVMNSIMKYGGLVEKLSEVLMVDDAAAHAVIAVESAGQGMDPETNKPIIRFETHVFHRKWGKYHQQTFDKYWSFNKAKPWEGQTYNGQPFHGNQSLEWESFALAESFDRDMAIESISIGAGQIMGWHWNRLGYHSPRDFLLKQSMGEREQILAMFDLIASDSTMLTALQELDWWTFALKYNGSGQTSTYAEWLALRHKQAANILRG